MPHAGVGRAKMRLMRFLRRGETGIDVEKLKSQKDMEGLVRLLGHRNRKVGKRAAEALLEVAEQSVEKLVYLLELFSIYFDRYCADRTIVIDKLEEGGRPGAEPLLHALKDQSRYFMARVAMVQILGKIAYEQAIATFIQILEDEEEDESVRSVIASTIGEVRDATLVDTLIAIVGCAFEPAGLRWTVARALGDIGNRRAVRPLTRLASNDSSEWVRLHAREAVEKIEGRDNE